MLNPQTPLFREARYLLAEETDIREPAIYHSVLACHSAAGFDQDLRGQAARTPEHILLIGTDDLYAM